MRAGGVWGVGHARVAANPLPADLHAWDEARNEFRVELFWLAIAGGTSTSARPLMESAEDVIGRGSVIQTAPLVCRRAQRTPSGGAPGRAPCEQRMVAPAATSSGADAARRRPDPPSNASTFITHFTTSTGLAQREGEGGGWVQGGGDDAAPSKACVRLAAAAGSPAALGADSSRGGGEKGGACLTNAVRRKRERGVKEYGEAEGGAKVEGGERMAGWG